MTKRDYIIIAGALLKARPRLDFAQSDGAVGERLGWVNTVWAMADALVADNPRFDEVKFYRAAGVAEGLDPIEPEGVAV
jgi:hypothetical protein